MSTAGLLFLISAPSGAGKTSLVNAALERDPRLVVSVSHTTRPRRGSEEDGVNYYFCSPETFSTMVAQGEFLEHATVFGNQYGTARSQVQQLLDDGRDVILEIDWQGADQVRKLQPAAVSIFILPPSLDTLAKRLAQRGQDTQQSIAHRLAKAEEEIAQADRYDYVLVNDDFPTTLEQLLTIFRCHRLRTDQQLQSNETVHRLLCPD